MMDPTFCIKITRGRVKGFYDVLENETECYDDNGHGTHVARIIRQMVVRAGDNIWEWHRDVAFCRLSIRPQRRREYQTGQKSDPMDVRA